MFKVILSLALICFFATQATQAQGIFESQAVRGLSAGMGSGMAAGLSNGKVVQRSYERMVEAQQAGLALTKTINEYVSFGTIYEQKKDWLQADKCFRFVLQLIARRDGPGSKSTVPILTHLVVTSKAQNKLDEALAFQKTILSFAQSCKVPDTKVILQAQQDLASVYMLKQDYVTAAPILKDSLDRCYSSSEFLPKQLQSIKKKYASTLRKLNREAEAVALEGGSTDSMQSAENSDTTAAVPSEANSTVSADSAASAASSKQQELTPVATGAPTLR